MIKKETWSFYMLLTYIMDSVIFVLFDIMYSALNNNRKGSVGNTSKKGCEENVFLSRPKRKGEGRADSKFL